MEVADHKGFLFLTPQNGKSVLYQDPSTSSPTVGNPPAGARDMYTQVVYQKNGEPAWYLVHPPAATPGWAPAGDVSGCRPSPLPLYEPSKLPDDGKPIISGVCTGCGGARG
jgi:hypothetical protein